MNLQLGEELRAKILQVRKRQAEELKLYDLDNFFSSNEVVRINDGMGYGTYVGTDGRVTVWFYGGGEEPVIVENPRDIASIIVRWARNVDLSELISLLPAKPSDAIVCDRCAGERVHSIRLLFRDAAEESILCKKCSGLGWVPITQ
jgi:hypothetical protein